MWAACIPSCLLPADLHAAGLHSPPDDGSFSACVTAANLALALLPSGQRYDYTLQALQPAVQPVVRLFSAFPRLMFHASCHRPAKVEHGRKMHLFLPLCVCRPAKCDACGAHMAQACKCSACKQGGRPSCLDCFHMSRRLLHGGRNERNLGRAFCSCFCSKSFGVAHLPGFKLCDCLNARVSVALLCVLPLFAFRDTSGRVLKGTTTMIVCCCPCSRSELLQCRLPETPLARAQGGVQAGAARSGGRKQQRQRCQRWQRQRHRAAAVRRSAAGTAGTCLCGIHPALLLCTALLHIPSTHV